MWNIDTLSRVAESRSSPRVTREPAALAAKPTQNRQDRSEPAATPATAATATGRKALEEALGNLSAHVQNLQRSLRFSVDEESGETIVKVFDTETKEVIRQIPSEELLAISNRLRSAAGVLLTDEA
ncbi:MAG: flagellar protein FlaG [Gammaproteobacteria bacterium]